MNIIKGIIKYTNTENKSSKKIKLEYPINTNFENEDIKILPFKEETKYGFNYKIKLIPKKHIKVLNSYLECSHNYNKNDKIFLNGFQSWTETKEFDTNEKIKDFNTLLKPILNYYNVKNFGESHFFKRSSKKGILHSFTYSYIKDPDQNFILTASLNEKTGYTIFNHNTNNNSIQIIKDLDGLELSNEYNIFELIILEGREKEIFEQYYKNLKIKKPNVKMTSGWTSWYNYYGLISEDIILKNTKNFAEHKIPIDIIQIDDGYNTGIGDWLSIVDSFPNGMKYVADQIKKHGFKSGIWIAPFLVQKRSKLFKEKYDWILKFKNGKPVRLGYSKGYWNDHFYSLDFYNEDVRKYIKKVFDVFLNEWGYDLLKIDFLYAESIIPCKGKTRAQVMTEAMEFIREISGDKLLLGCGVPLATAFGITEYCRIGSDVALTWENNLYKSIHFRERVSTINSLLSTIHSRHMNYNVFYNDPDVFILRDENNSLTKDQKYTLFLLNHIFGGLIFTSDNIANYNSETLKLYKEQFPLKKKDILNVSHKNLFYIINFKIDNLEYIVFSNLSNKPQNTELESGIYFDSKKKKLTSEKNIILKPYESKCFLKINNDKFSIAGSMNHIFPGSEIDKIEINKDNINININKKLINKNKIFLKIPDKFKSIKINGKSQNAEQHEGINMVSFIP